MITLPFASARVKEGFKRTQDFRTNGHGYFLEQSTKPQTIGYSLSDSPVGLLAWIYEKLVAWTDGYAWTDDEGKSSLQNVCVDADRSLVVLTWISIYWFSRNGPTAAGRIYYEYREQNAEFAKFPYVKVPSGASFFPKEILQFPPS